MRVTSQGIQFQPDQGRREAGEIGLGSGVKESNLNQIKVGEEQEKSDQV
jgi:hypothetical protein